jgi:predicted phosphate transport protein (TIGR00153 family)
MSRFFRRLLGPQQEIQRELEEYLDHLGRIALDMRKAIGAYLDQNMEAFSGYFQGINEVENRLDTLRRNIEAKIYGQSLLPDTRGDILGLLESLDKIPNRIQALTRELGLQKVQIPQGLHESLIKLADQGAEIVKVLVLTAQAFLRNPYEVKERVEELSHREHEGDLIEHQALALTFDDTSLELAHKMQLYHLVDRLGSICDMAEDVGDRAMIASLKRLL